ncbi:MULTISPECIES: IclR family transcriptional regulator [Microbacterium]|uniref:IclR family transcriptional regulator n=2 Tax=Microbacteriaceae TaxID=85023 RepID=UPI001EF5CD37|nr:IclR family transcriptional regulator C-terminal domain-containing protein [Microbacterium paraoxydans]MCG7415555.1 helix-turn-helix domain-containing protein [Microbacterium aurum]MCT2225090.1 helix-turn-helix domain-containing protein [Microbacterium paraoxydans]
MKRRGYNPTMQNPGEYSSGGRRELVPEPKYMLGSVDGALQLLQLLRDEGSLRVMTAAERVGVSRSTAHRLLCMLTYRGFAVQDEDRVYRPGPGMNVPPVRTGAIREFKSRTEQHFLDFVAEIEQTVSLVTRFGTTSRFIETYVPRRSFAVSSRRGQILPAMLTSGGKMLLSLLPDAALAQLYRSDAAARSGTRLSDAQFRTLTAELRRARDQGHALNREATERGVWALSMPLRPPEPGIWLAFAVAVPAEKSELFSDEAFLERCREFKRRVDHVTASA